MQRCIRVLSVVLVLLALGACGQSGGSGTAEYEGAGGSPPPLASSAPSAVATSGPADGVDPSDALGFGSGDVWYPVAPDGAPIDVAEGRADRDDGY